MIVKELVVSLLKCNDQEARVFYGNEAITSCDEIVWTEEEKKLAGKELKNRVELTTYKEEGDYGQVA